MELNPDNVADLREIKLRIDDRLANHEDEVIATLELVERGELEIVETITPQEKEIAQVWFGWIADVGPEKVWQWIQELLPIMEEFPNTGIILPVAWEPNDDGFGVMPPVPDLDGRTLLKGSIFLLSYIFYEEFHYPQPETGVYDVAGNPFEKIKWVYRYWFNQLEVAEEDSGLEEFFSSQILDLKGIYILLNSIDEARGATDKITLSCAGDLLAVDVLAPENTPHLFDGIVDFYSTADIVSANLESTVDKSRHVGRTQETGQPARMNTSQEMFQKFRDEAGINFFATATNHALDWGEQGVLATLDVLEESGAYYSGTARSRGEQDDVVVFVKNGIRVALLSYTFDLNGYNVPAGKPYLVNEVRFNDVNPGPDYSLIKKQVALANAKGAHYIIAYCHWGWEFEMYPHANIVDVAQEIIDCGVDTILGNHPHVSQPAQLITRGGSHKQEALVIYAFGDFVSYHPESRNSKLAYIVKFDIRKDPAGPTGRGYITDLEALPIYIVNEDLGDGSFDCRIVKFDDVLANPDGFGLTETEKSELPHLRDNVWGRILSPLSDIP